MFANSLKIARAIVRAGEYNLKESKTLLKVEILLKLF